MNRNLKGIIKDNRGGAFLNVLLGLLVALGVLLWVMLIVGFIERLGTEPEVYVPRDYEIVEQEHNQAEEPVVIDDPEEPEDENQSPVIADRYLSETNIFHDNPQVYAELDTLAERYNCMAVSLTVFDSNTGEFYTYEYGFADNEAPRVVDVDTKFRVASISNLVTAICVMTLVDEGKINLDADLKNYLGYDVRNSYENFSSTVITPRMLLQHTSSLFNSGAYEISRNRGSSESIQTILENGRSFRNRNPGTTFEYSNFGFDVLGAVCEKVSGKSLDALSKEKIFDPLGIDAGFLASNLKDKINIANLYEYGDGRHSVGRRVDALLDVKASETLGHDLHLASGNLTISSMDYAKILAMLTGDGTYEGKSILSESAVEEMLNTDVNSELGYMQGLGIRRSTDSLNGDFYWHSGSSYGMFAQYVYNISPSQGVVVITTGASIRRTDNLMIDTCTELAQTAFKVFENDVTDADDEVE